jgi:hypothetical protein
MAKLIDILDEPNGSFKQLLFWKIRVLKILLGEIKLFLLNFKMLEYRNLLKLKNQYQNQYLIVCATGPSLKENFGALNNLFQLERSKYKILAINDYALTALTNVEPDFYFLLDQEYFKKSNAKVINIIKKYKRTQVIMKMKDFKRNVFRNSIFIPGLTAPTLLKRLSIKSVSGFFDYTIFHALNFGLYLGFNHIYVIGFDNNRFKFIQNVRPNVSFYDMHSLDKSSYPFWKHRNSVKRVLLSSIRVLDGINKFPYGKISIIGNETLIDTKNVSYLSALELHKKIEEIE